MSALYRTYRPQTFTEVIGQTEIKTILQNAIVHSKTVHSYLFSGPRGTGKTTVARIMAKALNCLNRMGNTAEPCNTCTNCLSIDSQSFIDLVEIDAASNRGIDEIRNLKEAIRFAPSRPNGYKIYIIDESHMLTKEASNALLKTLEEPPHNTIFILATTDPQKMLPTIISRVQQLHFRPLTPAELKQKLTYILQQEQVSLSDITLNRIVVQAMGGARDAESILGKLLSLGETEITDELADQILGKNSYSEAYTLYTYLSHNQSVEALRHIQTLADNGFAIDQLIGHLTRIGRAILLAQFDHKLLNSLSLLPEEIESIENYLQSFDSAKLLDWIRLLEQIKSQLAIAYLPQLPLEMAIAQIWPPDISSNQPTPTDSQAPSTPTDTIKSKPKIPKKHSQPQEQPPKNVGIKTEKDNPSSPPVEEKKSTSTQDLAQIKKYFVAIVKTLQKTNQSIATILAKSQPTEYTQKHITIAVNSEFYRSRLDKHQAIIREAMDQVLKTTTPPLIFILQDSISPIDISSESVSEDFGEYDANSPTSVNEAISDIFKDFI